MKSNTDIKIADAIKNAEKYIEQLKQMDDKKLSKHLDLFQQQLEKAYKQNKSSHLTMNTLSERYIKSVSIRNLRKKILLFCKKDRRR